MQVLFQATISKSAIDRWVDETASALPSEDEMVKLLHRQKPITQGHFDELFPPDEEFQKKIAWSSFYHTETDLR
jgi:hypothetical protein